MPELIEENTIDDISTETGIIPEYKCDKGISEKIQHQLLLKILVVLAKIEENTRK